MAVALRVRFWPLADIPTVAVNAIGGKADMP
jgi:hypothetical protein